MQSGDNRKEEKMAKYTSGRGVSGGAYGLAFIGAAVYYLQQA